MVACPSSSWIVRRSAPPSSRWVAKECRSVCGVAPGGVPARVVHAAQAPPEVRRAEPAAALREEDRALARLAPRAPAAAGRARGRRSSARHACSPTGTTRSLPPLPCTRSSSASKSASPRSRLVSSSGAQPGRVGQLEDRAVAQLERRRGRDRVEQRADLLLLEHARAGTGRASGVATRSAGLAAISSAVDEVAVERPHRRELPRDRRLRGAALGEHAGEHAQAPVVDVSRARAAGRPPTRRAARRP